MKPHCLYPGSGSYYDDMYERWDWMLRRRGWHVTSWNGWF